MAVVDVLGGEDDYIYLSSDSGVVWTRQDSAGPQVWVGVASSSDGNRLVAIGYRGYIYTASRPLPSQSPTNAPTLMPTGKKGENFGCCRRS